MGKLLKEETGIEGLSIITPKLFLDSRGYFFESYNKNDFKEIGIDCEFVQDNQSKSSKGVLRGLHYQKQYSQAKLVRVIKGSVYDVAVDLRPASPTFGEYRSVILTAENKKQFFIPKGFAHGFLVLSPTAEFTYKCDDFYHPEDEAGILWSDKTLNIFWPVEEVKGNIILSDKDKKWPSLEELKLNS